MNRQEALKYYEIFLDTDNEEATDGVRKAYSTMQAAFEEYVCALQEDMFQKAFRYGFRYGLECTRTGQRKINKQ